MMADKNGQTSIEFVILIGVVLFFVLNFLFYIQMNVAERDNERVAFMLRETALTIQNEINLASKSVDGYYREFTLPNDILGHTYQIQVVDNLVYLRTVDGRNAISFPVNNVSGSASQGVNKIRRDKGMVYLNQ